MNKRRKSIGKLRTWIVLACLLPHSVSFVCAQPDEDWEAEIKNGIYLQNVKGDTAEAVEIYERVLQEEHLGDVIKAEAAYRLMDCYLQMHQEGKAQQTFQMLQTQFPGQRIWLQAALSKVPDSFLHREIPWKEGEHTIYCWTNPRGEKVGVAVLAVSKVRKDDHVLWRLESRMIGDAYRQYIIEFEPDSLQPSYSFYQLRRFDPLEVRQLALLGVTEDESLSVNSCDHEAVGMLLRQFPLQLGYRVEEDLFKASEGSGVPSRIEVLSIETLELPGGRKAACYAVEADVDGEPCRFWLENNPAKGLVKFRGDDLSGERVFSEVVGNEPFREFSLGPSGMRLSCPTEWFPIMKPCSDRSDKIGIVFLMPSLNVSFWIEETPNETVEEETAEKSFGQFCETNSYENLKVRKLGESLPGLSPKGLVMTAEKQAGREMRAVYRGRWIVNNRYFEATGLCNADQLEEWEPQFERVIASLRKD